MLAITLDLRQKLFYAMDKALSGELSYTWTGLVYYRNKFYFCGLYQCVNAGKLLTN